MNDDHEGGVVTATSHNLLDMISNKQYTYTPKRRWGLWGFGAELFDG